MNDKAVDFYESGEELVKELRIQRDWYLKEAKIIEARNRAAKAAESAGGEP